MITASCAYCGAPMTRLDNEVTHHLTSDGRIDHYTDSEHVAYDEVFTV